METEVNHWHSQSIEHIYEKLDASKEGLNRDEVEKRLSRYGTNEISKKKKESVILKFLKQFNSPLIYILFAAMIISFIFDHVIDAYVILGIVLINATIGFVQERKAERAIDSLKKLIVSYAKVERNGEVLKIPSKNLVPGDIILLEEGDKIPADARIIEMKDFKTQESSLTGESFPEEKYIKVLPKTTSLGDRTNMVFMSTLVVSGTAKALVVSTANKTQIGQVAKSIQEVAHPKLHFNKKVTQLATQMAIFALIGALLIFLIGFFVRGLEFFDVLLFTIASLVSGIPEGLPAVLIIVLAVGARRMAKRNAVIRHLPAVETLGVATIIATDKTGTLTQNSINVQKIITADNRYTVSGNGWEPVGKFFHNKKPINPLLNSSLKKSLIISALCNKGNLARQDGTYEVIGDPTEVSLIVLGKKARLDKEKLEDSHKIIDDFPFNSELKLRATLVQTLKDDKRILFSVGAFEKVLNKSRYIERESGRIILDNKTKQALLKKATKMAKEGYRVVSLAYKNISPSISSISEDTINDLTFVSFLGMKDPPRKDVKEAIQKAKNAGIRVIMKTGDHKETAIAIAKEIGLVDSKNVKALSQEELEKLSNLEFNDIVKKVNIFARVTPKMKMRIVKALQEQGEIVAMTGDGVNDAPALKRADIGISMGIIGTDVARESSEIVLTDDNFSSIVNAIEEGRIVFKNVRQTSFFLVTTNVAEHITTVSALALGFPLPMLPIQLLYLNFVTDTFNGVALSMEPGHGDVLNQPPRNKKEMILNKEVIVFLLFMAGLMVLGTLPLFNHYLPEGIDKARTIAFVTMSTFQLFNVLNMRSIRRSIFSIGFFTNKFVIMSLIGSLLLTVAVVYIPFIQKVFQFVPLKLTEFLFILLIASSVLIFGEIYKKIRYKGKNNNGNNH